jgi:hypothetical protein
MGVRGAGGRVRASLTRVIQGDRGRGSGGRMTEGLHPLERGELRRSLELKVKTMRESVEI